MEWRRRRLYQTALEQSGPIPGAGEAPAQSIMPAATVSFEPSSIKMKLPVVRLRL